MTTTMKASIVVIGPQGCGKTRHAQQLLSIFGLARIHDGDAPGPLPAGDALILCNTLPRGAEGLRVVQFHDIQGLKLDGSDGRATT